MKSLRVGTSPSLFRFDHTSTWKVVGAEAPSAYPTKLIGDPDLPAEMVLPVGQELWTFTQFKRYGAKHWKAKLVQIVPLQFDVAAVLRAVGDFTASAHTCEPEQCPTCTALARSITAAATPAVPTDMQPKLPKAAAIRQQKPWGKEVVVPPLSHDGLTPAQYKVLRVNPGGELSVQYHPQRTEWLMLISGIASLNDHIMDAYIVYTIPPRTIHHIVALGEQGAVIFEWGTEEDVTIRLSDKYGRR